MKKSILAAALAVVAGTAYAAFFASAESSVDGNGALVVAFDERGLGNGNVNLRLTASATAIYACFNNGGKHPQSLNKVGPSTLSADQLNVEPKNGRIRSSIQVGPPDSGTFTCPGGQTLELACVSYTDVLLQDQTNHIDISPTGTTSRTFINAKGVNC